MGEAGIVVAKPLGVAVVGSSVFRAQKRKSQVFLLPSRQGREGKKTAPPTQETHESKSRNTSPLTVTGENTLSRED